MNKKLVYIGCVLLFILSVLPYLQSRTFDFIRLDDMGYVRLNAFVITGLTWKNICAAWTAVGYAGNWHPLTWMSLQADVSLFGPHPGAMHLHNAILHGLNTALLFLILCSFPGREEIAPVKRGSSPTWTHQGICYGLLSFLAALFWGIHPLRVEAVAWVCERKEVLSVFWSLIAILLYFKSIINRSDTLEFSLSIVASFFAVAAKPVAVSLPVILCVYDIFYHRRFRYLKCIPWVLLCVLCCVLTSLAQQEALARLEMLSISRRLMNALASIGIYVWQIFDVRHLALFYPFREQQPLMAMLGGGSVLALMVYAGILSLVRIWRGPLSRQQLSLVLGCTWCSAGLIPMLGIVQVGSQAHADRYTYWVGCGFAVLLLTGMKKVVEKGLAVFKGDYRGLFALIVLLGSAGSILFGYCTYFQVQHWKDSRTIYEHAERVIPDNAWASWSLADYYASSGDPAKAEALYRKAIAANPNDLALGALAVFKAVQSPENLDEAYSLATRALRLNPQNMDANEAMGILALRAQAWDQAEKHFRISLKVDSQRPFVLEWLAMALHNQKKYGEACRTYEKAIKLMPERSNLRTKYEQSKSLLKEHPER